VDGKSVKNVGKSTYGERIGFSATSDADLGRLRVIFMKNGNSVHFVIFHFLNRIAAQCAWYEMQNVLADVAWSVCLSVCVRKVARSPAFDWTIRFLVQSPVDQFHSQPDR